MEVSRDSRVVGITRKARALDIFLTRKGFGPRRSQRCAPCAVSRQQCSVNVEEDELHSSESGGSGGSSSSGGANRRLRLLIGRGESVMLMLFPMSLGSISACPIVAKSSLSRVISW